MGGDDHERAAGGLTGGLGGVDELPQPGGRGLRAGILAVVVAQPPPRPSLRVLVTSVRSSSMSRRVPLAAIRATRSLGCQASSPTNARAAGSSCCAQAVRPQFQVDVDVAAARRPGAVRPDVRGRRLQARGLQRADGLRGHLCDGHAADVAPRRAAATGRVAARTARASCVTAGRSRPAPRRAARARSTTHAVPTHCGAGVARAGRPWRTSPARPARSGTGVGECRVAGCSFSGDRRRRALRRAPPQLRVAALAPRRARTSSASWRTSRPAASGPRPRFDLRGVGPVVALELGYALQCRHDQRGAAITPLIFGQVVRWLRERPVDSLLIGSDAAWAARGRAALPAVRARATRWPGCATAAACSARLRDERHGGEVWDWDTWPTEPHRPRRPLRPPADAADLLRRHRARLAARAGQALGALADHHRDEVAGVGRRARPARCGASTAGWPTATRCPPTPAAITRALLEDYRAHVHTLAGLAGRDAAGC